MPEYMHTRRGDEAESFFCRFTFGQFFALLVLEVFTLFFVFYLGARYGRGLLGLDQSPAVAVEEGASSYDAADQPRVPTTADPEVARMAGDLVAKAETPELKDRIRKMIDEAQSEREGRTPEVVGITRPEEAEKRVEVVPPPAEQSQAARLEARAAEPAPRESPSQDEATGMGESSDNKKVPADTGVIRVKSAENARYSVQIGSYPSSGEAKNVVDRWKNKGYPAYLMIADIPDRGRWYRVRIGGFETRDEAARYLRDLSSKENVEALVVLNEQ